MTLRGMRYFAFTAILFAVIAAFIYGDALRGDFHYDDFSSIVHNPAVHDPRAIIALWHYWPTRFIAYFSLAVNYRLGGLDTYGYHLANLTMHVAASLTVWLLALLTFSTASLRRDCDPGDPATAASN